MSATSQPQTIPELFFARTAASGPQTALLHKQAGSWREISWRQYETQVRQAARGMADWLGPRQMAAILSENRPEWCFADLATMALGGVSVPIYPTNPAKDVAYILNDCGAKLLFVSTTEQLDKLRALKAAGQLPQLERVVVFDSTPAPEDWVLTWAELLRRNSAAADPIPERLASLKQEELATLIYTSGTTGQPKGVMLSHHNIVHNTLGARVILDHIDVEERLMLSFLPLSHTLERTAGYYVAIHYGFKVAFAESVLKLVDNMGEVHPTLLVSVPRIYEKLYSRVLESARSPLKSKLVHWAIATGKAHARFRLAGKRAPLALELKYRLATKLVFAKLHQRMGGRMRYAISGGAPLAPEIAEFLGAAGLSVFEGYGLTETSPVISANRPYQLKVGSVGLPWPGMEIMIAPEPDRERDGEILTRGASVMMGYYNKPEATAEVLDAQGWLKTGDIGYLDRDGYLFITDRKKELIKTAGGKYVAPQPIENQLKVHPLVEQAVVVGDRRKYCVALIVPAFEALQNTLEQPLPEDRRRLNDDPQVRSLIQQAVDQVNADLGSWEQIKRFHLLAQELTQETDELTPTLKIKRRVVDEKYKAEIDSMYPTS